MKTALRNLHARQILDSRGFPTVEVDVILECGAMGRAAVPSGASTGKFEALEKRDHDPKHHGGKGVLTVIETIHSVIFPHIQGLNAAQQEKIDQKLIDLDGTDNKSNLGANAMLAVSLACAKAAAKAYDTPLYRYLGGTSSRILPMPLINIINGGAHANNGVSIQEFMIVPVGASSFSEGIEKACAVFHSLQSLLKKQGLSTAVGDEGGFAPPLKNTQHALDLICEAIEKAHLKPGQDIALALDAAASEFYDTAKGLYYCDGEHKTTQEMIHFYDGLIQQYPLVSMEDPLDEDDFKGYTEMTHHLGKKVQIVGDDLFVTNLARLKKGMEEKACNSILIKLNQIGTLSETLHVIEHAKNNGYTTIISHRSGETEDTFISDLAVGINAGQIKTGSLCRSERIAKYNQLLRIEEELGSFGSFAKGFRQ